MAPSMLILERANQDNTGVSHADLVLWRRHLPFARHEAPRLRQLPLHPPPVQHVSQAAAITLLLSLFRSAAA